MKKIIVVLLAAVSLNCSADSPLTSTFFAMAYNDIPVIGSIMQRRMTEGIYNLPLTTEHLAFFDNNDVSLDQKIALINGLGWGETTNTEVYMQHLMQKYTLTHDVLDSALVPRDPETIGLWQPARLISNNDLVILCYLQIMGDYFQPEKGWNCVMHAMENNPTSEATAYVAGLLAAQLYLDINWCNVYLVMEEVSMAPYEKDFMRPEAILAIMEYISLYQTSCDEQLASEYQTILPVEWTAEYWSSNPCYIKPAAPQVSQTGQSIDLELLNDATGAEMMYTNWVNYEESIDGTVVVLRIRNNGNTTSIPTNATMVISESDDTVPHIMVQSAIPAITGGSVAEVRIQIAGYWIYNPDASFDIEIDFDNNIEESNEENNKKWFFEQG